MKPEQETMDRAKNAWLEVQWQGATLDLLCLNRARYWILADTQEIVRAFFVAVCKWNTELHAEVLVFDGGRWYKDEHLFQDIKKELILSSMMQWIARPGQFEMEQVMVNKVATLREQMVSMYSLDDGEADSEQTGPVRRFRGSQGR